MSRLVWDQVGERFYETGVKQCVLYPIDANGAYSTGVAWNGITAINENPSGAEPTPHYADDIKYLNLMSTEEFGASIEAYTYPDEFAMCDGSAEIAPGVSVGQQSRTVFGLCYKTTLGNDTDGTDHGYKLHIIYGALAAPSQKGYSTISDSPEAITLSWDLTTTPVSVSNRKPTAAITINSTKVAAAKLAALENILYGTNAVAAVEAVPAVGNVGEEGYVPAVPAVAAVEATVPRLPLPDEIATLMAAA